MFELNERITSWRGSFAGMSAEHLDELEEHLRLEIANLAATGLSEAEAFLVARTRLGPSGELEGEYSKVHVESVWMRRVQWMALGFLAINAVKSTLGMLGWLAAWATVRSGMGSSGAIAAQSTLRILFVAILVWGSLRIARSPLPQGRKLLSVCLILAVVAPLAWVGRVAGTYGFYRVVSPGQVEPIAIWNSWFFAGTTVLLPILALALVFGLERRRRAA